MMDDCTIKAMSNIAELREYVDKLSYDISGRFRLKKACPWVRPIEECPGYADMPEEKRRPGYYDKSSNTVYLTLELEWPATGQNIPAHELGHAYRSRNKKGMECVMARYIPPSAPESTDAFVIPDLDPVCNYIFHMKIAEEAVATALGAAYFSGELPDGFKRIPLFSQVDFLPGGSGAESFEDVAERISKRMGASIIMEVEMKWSKILGKQIGAQFGLHVVRKHSPDQRIREMITGDHLALIDEALEFNAGLPEGGIIRLP